MQALRHTHTGQMGRCSVQENGIKTDETTEVLERTKAEETIENELAKGIAEQIMDEITQDDEEDVQGTNENYESREVRGLRDGLTDEEKENMGRTRQQTAPIQIYLKIRKSLMYPGLSEMKLGSIYHTKEPSNMNTLQGMDTWYVFAQIIDQISHMDLNQKDEKEFYYSILLPSSMV